MAETRERDELVREFRELVNMTPKELEGWLGTEESQEAGQRDGGGESIGHASGRRIVDLLRTNPADYSDDDLDHMQRVRGYIRRHLAQRPDGDVAHTTWRHSLMNWGHDPLKD